MRTSSSSPGEETELFISYTYLHLKAFYAEHSPTCPSPTATTANMRQCLLPIAFFKIRIYLFIWQAALQKEKYRRDGEWEIFHPLVLFPHDHNRDELVWNQETGASSRVPRWVTGRKYLSHFSLHSQTHLAGNLIGSKAVETETSIGMG